ncbi:MAG TPA: hypothetical protein VF230_10795, partial [Acidimicrobiales bacterium]
AIAAFAGPVIVLGAVVAGFLWRRQYARIAVYALVTAWTAWMTALSVWGFEVKEADTAPRLLWVVDGAIAIGLLAFGWWLEDVIARRRTKRVRGAAA